ncbi:MAG: twin-arginine translocation signal domain-containing protein, partial [Anaerolineae bacterium]
MLNDTMSRRKFLRLSAGVAGSAAMISAPRLVYKMTAPAPTTLPAHLETSGENRIIPTVCALCPSGCGMLARVADGNLVKAEGSPMHPVNLGALCPKG